MYKAGAEDERDEGRPGLATAIASAILLLSTCSRPADRMTAGGTESIAYLLGGVLASVLIFWGIPFLITIRKSSTAWKIGSLVVIAVLSILANLWLMGRANLQLEADVKEQARQAQEIAAGKRTRLEADPNAGPLQKIMVEIGNRNIADVQSYHAALVEDGGERIAMMQGLQRNSSDLRNCQRFNGLAARARADRGRLATYVADARGRLDAEVARGTLAQEAVNGFLKGVEDSKPDNERMWELQAQYAEAVGKICGILARNNWRLEQGQVAFTSNADLNAANAQLALIQRLGTEQERMRIEAINKMQRLPG